MCRIKRGGSRGFVLNDDSLDEGFYMESLNQGQNWLEKYQNKFSNGKSDAKVFQNKTQNHLEIRLNH